MEHKRLFKIIPILKLKREAQSRKFPAHNLIQFRITRIHIDDLIYKFFESFQNFPQSFHSWQRTYVLEYKFMRHFLQNLSRSSNSLPSDHNRKREYCKGNQVSNHKLWVGTFSVWFQNSIKCRNGNFDLSPSSLCSNVC